MVPSSSQPIVGNGGIARQSARRRWCYRLLRSAAIVYILFALFIVMVQERLIFPGAYMPVPAAYRQQPAASEPFRLTLSNGLEVGGLFLPAPSGAAIAVPAPAHRAPTVLYFYGNGDSLATSASALELFRNCGANVLAVDYPGYGSSTGKPSEANCYAAASALWDYALTRAEVDPAQIVAVGWSLGGAVATDLVYHHPSAAGLFTISTFTSMGEMARRQMPFLPTGLLLRHHFRNLEKIPAIRCPVIIAHGKDDTMIPFSMSLRLRDAATGAMSVQQFGIPDAGHNDVLTQGHHQITVALKSLLAGFDKQYPDMRSGH